MTRALVRDFALPAVLAVLAFLAAFLPAAAAVNTWLDRRERMRWERRRGTHATGKGSP